MRRYQLPTHLNMPDRISFPLLLFSVNLTVRQFLLLVITAAGCFHLFRWLAFLESFGLVGFWLRVGLLAFVAGCVLVLVLVRIAGRELWAWVQVWLRYQCLPHIAVWYPVILVDHGFSEHHRDSDKRKDAR